MKPVFADILMILHFLWAAFMVIGLPLGLWLRSGAYCPLTIWEESLRWEANPGFTYEGGFLAHHLSSILYPQIEPWILRSVSAFWGALTVLAMIVIRPGKQRGK